LTPALTILAGGQVVDGLAVEGDLTLRDLPLVDVEQAGDRPQQRGLAGAVAPRRATILPSGTSMLTPRSTRMTPS
jgi:hypothetical protein